MATSAAGSRFVRNAFAWALAACALGGATALEARIIRMEAWASSPR